MDLLKVIIRDTALFMAQLGVITIGIVLYWKHASCDGPDRDEKDICRKLKRVGLISGLVIHAGIIIAYFTVVKW